jgi:hypothetical protein
VTAFYERDGELLRPTELTRGPWDPKAQHAGPPAALLGRAIEALDEGPEFQLGRITLEIVRPVPIAPLRAEARVVRPGRRVQLVEASLSDEAGEVMLARGWRLRRASVELPAVATPADPPPPSPAAAEVREFFDTGQAVGFHTAMEARFIEGAWTEPGPATVWMRMRQPLVEGEEPSPLQRVLVAADAGNGVSAALDLDRYLFINVDISVHLERMPVGEWVCVDAVTIAQPTGVGTADTMLLDERGRIGRAVQTLLVGER